MQTSKRKFKLVPANDEQQKININRKINLCCVWLPHVYFHQMKWLSIRREVNDIMARCQFVLYVTCELWALLGCLMLIICCRVLAWLCRTNTWELRQDRKEIHKKIYYKLWLRQNDKWPNSAKTCVLKFSQQKNTQRPGKNEFNQTNLTQLNESYFISKKEKLLVFSSFILLHFVVVVGVEFVSVW